MRSHGHDLHVLLVQCGARVAPSVYWACVERSVRARCRSVAVVTKVQSQDGVDTTSCR